MFSRHLNRFCLAFLKANKPKTHNDLSVLSINRCRSLLGMPACGKQDLAAKTEQYMKERSELSLDKEIADSVFKNWQTTLPLDCEINILASRKEMGTLQSTYIYKIMYSWGSFFLQQQAKLKQSPQTRQAYKRTITDYSKVLTTTCYLLTLDQNMIILYLRVHFLIQSLRSEDRNQSHLRFIFDALLKLKILSLESVDFLLMFTSRYPMQNIYHQKEKEIMHLIYSNIPNLSRQKKYNTKLTINLLHNLIQQTQISKEMRQLAINIYQNFKNNYLRYRAFVLLLQIFVIDQNNIRDQHHLQNLMTFTQEVPNEAFKFLSKSFLRANIWIQQFWKPYFTYISQYDNFKEIDSLSHFIVDDLLVQSKVGGAQLQKTALRFREHMKSKGIEIQKYDIRKEYQRIFGRIHQSKHACQSQVASSMRLICGAQIQTEVPIKYFMVDVLVDKSIIVEINNTNHYKTIDGVTRLNLKSQFRERVLKESGYQCYNIRVDDLSTSNYSMLEEIYRIVESSGNMRKIVNGGKKE